MIGKGMAGKIFIAACAVLIIGGFYTTEANALPPSEAITCQGCSLLQESVDKFSAWVKKDSAITLTGPAGYQSYVWTGGGQTVSGQSFTVKIVSDVVFTLTLDGNKAKTVQINLTSPAVSCELIASEIKSDTTSFAVGQRVKVSVDFKEEKCPQAVVLWTVEGGRSSGLIIENPQNEEIWIYVENKPPDGKNPIIKFSAIKGFQSIERILMVTVGDNNKPTIESLSTTPAMPLSHRKVEINCDECFTGKGTRDQGDYLTEFIVRVKSLDGKFDKTFTQTFGKDNIKPISVSIGSDLENDFYSIEARTKDSRGAYSETFFDKIFVGFGNTKDDAPYIKLKPVVCDGLVCAFNTAETITNDLGLSRRYYLKTISGYELMYNVNGDLCTAEVCTTAFLKSGTYEVKITAQYMRGGKPSGKIAEKIVNMPVGIAPVIGYVSAQPTPAAVQQPQNQPTGEYFPVSTFNSAAPGECGKDYECPAAPDVGIFAAIAATIIAFWLKKIKRRKKVYTELSTTIQYFFV